MSVEVLQRRLRLSSILIAAGLVVEMVTLFWSHPLTFIAFLLLGGTLVALGVLLYLYSIVSISSK
ncbi:MAG TPA: hypothetical protein VJ921_14070 [Vicinamibacteria bacterium]|nr:hypothetical protein [Vicinamibacteria bacterium]